MATNVALNQIRIHARADRADEIPLLPKFPFLQPRAKLRKRAQQITSRKAFENVHHATHGKTRWKATTQMHMIGSNMKLRKRDVVRLSDFLKGDFKVLGNSSLEQWTATFGRPNKVIPAIVNAVGGSAKGHIPFACKSRARDYSASGESNRPRNRNLCATRKPVGEGSLPNGPGIYQPPPRPLPLPATPHRKRWSTWMSASLVPRYAAGLRPLRGAGGERIRAD